MSDDSRAAEAELREVTSLQGAAVRLRRIALTYIGRRASRQELTVYLDLVTNSTRDSCASLDIALI